MYKKSMRNQDFVGMHCAATRMQCALVVPCFEVNGQNMKGKLPSAFFLAIFEIHDIEDLQDHCA